jgi:hypothetical protein
MPTFAYFWENESQWDITNSFKWLKKANLSSGTEGLLFAIHDQAIMSGEKAHRLGLKNNNNYRRCHIFTESISHVLGGCGELAQSLYTDRHDEIAKLIFYSISTSLHIATPTKVESNKASVFENANFKLLWNFPLQTHNTVEANKPDILLFDKNANKISLFEISCPLDRNVEGKVKEKQSKYEKLGSELKSIWRASKVETIPLVVGATGMLPKGWKKSWKKIPTTNVQSLVLKVQTTVIVKSNYILRTVLKNYRD